MRMIDADALLEDARCDNALVAYLGGIETIQNIINDQPTIEVESVPQWIPVAERLPEENHDGSVNAVLVTDGFVQHMAYFAKGEWRFAESGEIKEPMWYSVTHWMPLPEPPVGR